MRAPATCPACGRTGLSNAGAGEWCERGGGPNAGKWPVGRPGEKEKENGPGPK
jgi:hypothetical protein